MRLAETLQARRDRASHSGQRTGMAPWIVVLLMAMTPGVSLGAAEDPILDVYRASGAEDVLKQYPKSFEATMISGRENTPPRIYRALETAFKETVSGARLDSMFLSRLRPMLSIPTAKDALKFLRSPTGRSATEAERQASTPEAAARMEEYFKELTPDSDPSRRDLLRILDAATRTSEAMANLNMSIQHAFAVALDAAGPEAERRGSDVLWALIRQNEAQARFEAQQQAAIIFLYTYRALSKKELREYIDFATSESGLDYHRVITNVTLETLMDVNREMAKVLAREAFSE